MKYQLNEPCIIAPNKPNTRGYVMVREGEKRLDGKRPITAHRFAYTMTYGPPPPDKPFILHKCNNKSCWNPSHLYAGTRSDNVKDCQAAGTYKNGSSLKSHCPKGHSLSGDNLIAYDLKIGRRICRICKNKRQIANYYKKQVVK